MSRFQESSVEVRDYLERIIMKKKEVVEKPIVDTIFIKSTGELRDIHENEYLVIHKKKEPEQEYAIKQSIETKELNEEVKEWSDELGGFVFVLFKYSDTILKQHPEITPEDITKLFYLATYVDYQGYLIYNNSYMSRNSMKELLNIHISSFDAFFNKMKKLNIFIQDKNKDIIMNKNYFSKGEIDKEIKQNFGYTRVYINTIRYLFENVPIRKHKQLGTYFKIIPYIHRQQNTLCWNPSDNRENINLMHVKDLKDILGYSDKGVRGFIKELLSTRLENGEAILGFFRTEYDEGKSYVIVNPKVFYGGNFRLEGNRNAIMKWFSK